MDRLNIYIGKEQHHVLKYLKGGNTSEHIRRAIDEYIDKRLKASVNMSPSERIHHNG